jgi:hypothetical protein
MSKLLVLASSLWLCRCLPAVGWIDWLKKDSSDSGEQLRQSPQREGDRSGLDLPHRRHTCRQYAAKAADDFPG